MYQDDVTSLTLSVVFPIIIIKSYIQILWEAYLLTSISTTGKVSKYGVFSGPYFPVFGLNTEIYGLNIRIQSECRKIRTKENSVFGHFSRSVVYCFHDPCYNWDEDGLQFLRKKIVECEVPCDIWAEYFFQICNDSGSNYILKTSKALTSFSLSLSFSLSVYIVSI